MKVKRILSALLAVILLFSTAAPVSAGSEPQIPGARKDGRTSLNGYDPERDGYFAYLPILHYAVPEDVTYSPAVRNDLPVIVIQNKIFVEAYLLMDIAGLDVLEVGGEITFIWGERALKVTEGQKTAVFTLGNAREGQKPYIETELSLAAAPFHGFDGGSYVPLADVCAMMGVDLIFKEDETGSYYAVNPPERDVYDVLASFRDDSVREEYMYFYEADRDALREAEESSRTVMVLDGLLNGKKDYILYGTLKAMSSMEYIVNFMPAGYVWKNAMPKELKEKDFSKEYWDMILAKNLIRELWFSSENEAVAIAEDIVNVTSGEIGLLFFNGLTDDALSGAGIVYDKMFKLQESIKATSFAMKQNTATKYMKLLERYETEIAAAESKWNTLNKEMTALTMIIQTGLSFVNNMTAYTGRDKVMDQALGQFFGYGGYYYLSNAAVGNMKREFSAYMKAPVSHAFKSALWDSVTDTVVSAVYGKAFGLASLMIEAYKVASTVIPEVQETMDSMVAYQTSLLSIAMQRETHDDAFRGILVNDSQEHILLKGQALDDDIRQAYMYFRSCATTRSLVEEAFKYEDPLLDTLYGEMLLLAHTASMAEEERPLPYAERIQEIGSTDSEYLKQLIPLYFSVSGNVVTFGDEKPVPNAECLVSDHDLQHVDFTADAEGKYEKIYVPIFWPVSGLTEFDPNFEMKFLFYSEEESYEGQDTKLTAFEAEAEKQLSDAHLLNTGRMEAAVVDKDTGEPIDSPKYRLTLMTPEPYDGIIEVQKSFSGTGDAGGIVRQGKLAPGTWKAVFSKEGYENETRTFEVSSGELTDLGKVELKKKDLWLLVAEDRRDIGMGCWSEYLEYAYDEEGRLLEVTGSDMDYTACVYDEDGRLIRKIGGTSGGYGAWTSEEYTYDSEDHIVEVIYSALTSTSARDMSDWKSASVQGDPYRETRSYDGDLLKEAVRYKPDGSVYYHEYYTYDEEGRLLQKETKDDGGNQSQLITYTYNEDGLLIEEEQLGSRAVTILYEYDEEGRLSKERNMYTQYSYTYLYDENGNLHLKRTYNAGGAMTWEYEYFYRKFPFEE